MDEIEGHACSTGYWMLIAGVWIHFGVLDLWYWLIKFADNR